MEVQSAKFDFATKAETLERLARLVRRCRVLALFYFRVSEWTERHDSIIDSIQERLGLGALIIRSSTASEDSERSSMAGVFASRLKVDGSDRNAIREAIEQVVASYRGNPLDQVLVQPMLSQVALSGVLMTYHLEDGSPYYVINYDDESAVTDSITSGTGTNKTVFIYRKANPAYVASPRIAAILEMARELEGLCGSVPLDIEFAMKRDGELCLFQVRRISVWRNWNVETVREVSERLPLIENFVQELSLPRSGLCGGRTILGNMPDWNPAEIIGSTPQPLATSLYRELITRSVWREARAHMGYRKLPAEELMVIIGGRPYIDVRNSFNSFLPEGLSDSTAGSIVEAWLERLETHPEYHDKIEFEIAQTCVDFCFDTDFKDRYPNVLSKGEYLFYRECLHNLTRQASGVDGLGTLAQSQQSIQRLAQLQSTRQLPAPNASGGSQALVQVRDLLVECKQLGTLPFSIIARHAFIAETLLRSSVRRGAISAERLQALKRSIRTISSSFANDLRAVTSGRKPPTEFMAKYGHLRPGTYDIKSLRYVDREELFGGSLAPEEGASNEEFRFTSSERNSLELLLREVGLEESGTDGFLEYVRQAIAGREQAKFVFTRNVSDSLEWLLRWGEGLSLSREHLANLEIEPILGTLTTPPLTDLTAYFLDLAERGRQLSVRSRALKLSHLIRDARDLYVIPQHRCEPNFIGSVHVYGSVARIDVATSGNTSLFHKIACIENADPGFDWIFGRGILGLITKYGGANSHMAIRCAEFGVPAAIGCGEQTFERIVAAGAVDLNCSEKVLRPFYGH